MEYKVVYFQPESDQEGDTVATLLTDECNKGASEGWRLFQVTWGNTDMGRNYGFYITFERSKK